MNRRDFLKTTFIFTGGIFVPATGMVRHANAWWHLHHGREKPGPLSGDVWADWDESDEDTLSVDQSRNGYEDTFICFFENTNAGGDETGRGGGLSGNDLVVEDVYNNVDGAVGSPPTRTCDASGTSKPQFRTVGPRGLLSNQTFTLLIKADNVMNWYYGDIAYFMRWKDDNLDLWSFHKFNASTNVDYAYMAGSWRQLSSGVPTNQIVWIAMASNGSETWWGWSNSKPTSKSDFNETATRSAVYPAYGGSYLRVCGYHTVAVGASLYYLLASSHYLF